MRAIGNCRRAYELNWQNRLTDNQSLKNNTGKKPISSSYGLHNSGIAELFHPQQFQRSEKRMSLMFMAKFNRRPLGFSTHSRYVSFLPYHRDQLSS